MIFVPFIVELRSVQFLLLNEYVITTAYAGV